MGFLWALGGIAAGTLLALLTGAIIDYLSVRNVLPESFSRWLFLPYTMGAAGFIGSVVSVSMYGRYLKTRGASGRAGATAKTSAPAGKSSLPKGMEHVPGMPVFDVEAIRRGQSSGPAATSESPAAGQRPVPPATPEQPQ